MNGGQVQLPKFITRGRPFFCKASSDIIDCPFKSNNVASGAFCPSWVSFKQCSLYHARMPFLICPDRLMARAYSSVVAPDGSMSQALDVVK